MGAQHSDKLAHLLLVRQECGHKYERAVHLGLVKYWKDQMEFWTLARQAWPTMIAISADGAVAINRVWYKRLADTYQAAWAYQGSLVGGHVARTDPRLIQAKWDVPKSVRPKNITLG